MVLIERKRPWKKDVLSLLWRLKYVAREWLMAASASSKEEAHSKKEWNQYVVSVCRKVSLLLWGSTKLSNIRSRSCLNTASRRPFSIVELIILDK